MKKILTVAALALFAACNTNAPAPTTDSAKIVPDSGAVVKAGYFGPKYTTDFRIKDTTDFRAKYTSLALS